MGLDSRDYYSPSGYGGFSFFPPVLKKIIIANVIVFFIQLVAGMFVYGYTITGASFTYNDWLSMHFALNPIGNGFEVWQLISYQFMHGGFTHILFNMFILWMFGMEIENVMGSQKFLIFYLLCGIGAGIFQLLFPYFLGEGIGPTIGASGAVFGVMIAFGMYFPDRYIYLYFLIPVKAKYLIAFMVVIEFMSVGNQSLIAHFAHVGGAVTGFLFILWDKKNRYRPVNLFGSIKRPSKTFSPGGLGRVFGSGKVKSNEIEDAEFYDIHDSSKNDDVISQEEIDRILDKISQSGYQNLTDREKKILFEASKRK